MTISILPIIISVIVFCVPGLIWLIRLEGKVKMSLKLFEIVEKQNLKRLDKLDDSMGELFRVVQDIKSIVDKLQVLKDGKL